MRDSVISSATSVPMVFVAWAILFVAGAKCHVARLL